MNKDYILPGRLRKKDGYYHMVIEATHSVTKRKIRHSKSTGLKVEEKTKVATKRNYEKAMYQLQDFRKQWTEYYFKAQEEKQESKKIFFIDYLKDWYEALKPSLQPNTVYNYNKIVFRKIIPYFEPKGFTLEDFKAKDIQDYYTYCQKYENLSGNTVCKHHAIIRKCLQTALKQELVKKNVADLVDRPKIQKYMAKTMTEEEIKKFIEFIKDSYFYIPTFLSLHYGLRRSEALGLLWSNIDFENKTILIGNTVIEIENRKIINRKRTKTASSYRTLPLTQAVENFLRKLKQEQEKYKKMYGSYYNRDYEDNVCVTDNGELIKPQYLTQHFKLVIRKLGFDDRLTFHSLRHTFATRIYSRGGDFKMLQGLLGHSNISTTFDIYTHFPSSKIDEASKIIEEVGNAGVSK